MPNTCFSRRNFLPQPPYYKKSLNHLKLSDIPENISLPSNLIGDMVLQEMYQINLFNGDPYERSKVEPSLASFVKELIAKAAVPTSVIFGASQLIKRLATVNYDWYEQQGLALLFTVCLHISYKLIEDSPYHIKCWVDLTRIELPVIKKTEMLVLNQLNHWVHLEDFMILINFKKALYYYKQIEKRDSSSQLAAFYNHSKLLRISPQQPFSSLPNLPSINFNQRISPTNITGLPSFPQIDYYSTSSGYDLISHCETTLPLIASTYPTFDQNSLNYFNFNLPYPIPSTSF